MSAAENANEQRPARNPFQRLAWLDLSTRQTLTSDKRLLEPRAGYPLRLRDDWKFWKSSDDGKEVKAPAYSEEKFCEGFNLTALDYYTLCR